MFSGLKKYLNNPRRRSRRIGAETQPQEQGPISHDVGVVHNDDVVLSFTASSASPRVQQRASPQDHDVILFDRPKRATPPKATAAASSKAEAAKLASKNVRAHRRPIRKYKPRESGIIEDEQKNMEKYNRYFVGRYYELYKRAYSNQITISMLNHHLKPPFNPSVLNSSVIDLLKRELELSDYMRLNDLINSTESINIRKQKSDDVEVIDVRALLISKFLSKITIIDLKNHEIDEFTLEVLNSIDKSKVFFIILYDIKFKNDATCSKFLEYIQKYKNHDNVKSLIVGKIIITGNNFEKLIDIIGELKSITFLFFTRFDIPDAMYFNTDEEMHFDEIFMKTLIKLENLKMLIFSDNFIEKEDFENIFLTHHRLVLFTDDDKDFIDFEPMSEPLPQDIRTLKEGDKYYTKKCEKKEKEGDINNRMLLSSFSLNNDEVVSSTRSFHFYTNHNKDDNKKMLIDLDDMLIKKNYYVKIFGILKKCNEKDTKAIQKAMLKQQEEDIVQKTKKEETALIDYLASIDITKQKHLDANKATQQAIKSNTENNNESAIARAIKKSHAATIALNNEQMKRQIANDTAVAAKAARKAVADNNTVARYANASSSPPQSPSLLSKKIEELKQSPSSNSPTKGTSQGGKKPLKRK